MIELLLRKRADPLAVNKQGKTPLELAAGDARAVLQAAADAKADAAVKQPAEDAEPAAAYAAEAQQSPAPDAAPAAGRAPEADAAAAPRPKRPASVADDEPVTAAAAAAAKRPKVVLSFDAGEGDEDEE